MKLAPLAPRDVLARILDEPKLVAAVRSLPPRALGQLVHQVGLEDLAEIVSLATPEQLVAVLDDDLWQTDAPGDDERFDDERFAVWLEVLLESGATALADKLAALPEELVAFGLHRQVLVLDMDELALEVAGMDDDDTERLERALDGALSHEIDRFRIISRRHEGWDAVLALLLALDERHPQLFAALLTNLAAASARYIAEHDDLCEALDAAETMAEDAAGEREDRRAAQGYVSPANARSFLALAAQTPVDQVRDRDPVTRAYFRELKPAAPAPRTAQPLLGLIERAAPRRHRALAEASSSAGPAGAFSAAMKALAHRDPDVHATRSEELAFLVNVLVAGWSRDGRALHPVEAVELATEICGLGLAHGMAPGADAIAKLVANPADRLFRIGWRLRSTADRDDRSPRGADTKAGRSR